MDYKSLLETIAQIGQEHPSRPELGAVEIFEHYFDKDTGLPTDLDRRDGACTRRELLLRYLLLNAVLDQGPDSEGVRYFLKEVTNSLYRQEVRFLHRPEMFFRELGVAVDQITSVHDAVKKMRAAEWARVNLSEAAKYSLFLDGAQQVLSYAVFRWGTPLAVPLLLTHDEPDENHQPDVLSRYIRGWNAAEIMSQQLKNHPRYGLGKAIGYKATHLYAKWIVHTFPLVDPDKFGWGPFGFEVPFDSNAGRVLFRTGFLLQWATLDKYKEWGVIRLGEGKGGTDYIRVTNIRGKKSKVAQADPRLFEIYCDLCVNYLKVDARKPRSVEIQRIPLVLLFEGGRYTPGELDDGLISIGTQFCFNHADPRCPECPIRALCQGFQKDRVLITDYRT